MPVRLTCPSCSAALSVKDEHAGRAIKCPKCGGVIPASAPAAPAAPPPPAPPAPLPPEPLDEPEKPAKTGGKITGAPTSARRKDEAEDEPRRKKPAAADRGEDEPPRKRRDEDDRDADEPPRKRRRDEDEDEDDRPRRRGKASGSSMSGPALIGIIFGVLLLCCGAPVGIGYYVVTKVRDKVQEVAGELEKWNPAATKANYEGLKVGTTTRAQAEQTLGKGRAPNADDLANIFGSDKSSAATWQGAVGKGRALMWRNADDYILVMFHPSAEADARVQMKQWKPKAPPGTSEGSTDDAAFVQKYPAVPKDDVSGPAVNVTGEDISAAYKTDRAAADAKYKDKVVLIEGTLEAFDLFGDVTYVRLRGVGNAGTGGVVPRITIAASELNKFLAASRGQVVKVRGRCVGLSGPFVDILGGKHEGNGPDVSVTATVATYFADYTRDEAGADAKYKDKALTLTNARVESKTADALYLVASTKTAKTNLRIKVSTAGDLRKLFENLKVGDMVKAVKGEGAGKFENEVYLNGAWIVP